MNIGSEQASIYKTLFFQEQETIYKTQEQKQIQLRKVRPKTPAPDKAQNTVGVF